MDFYYRVLPQDQVIEIPEYESFYFERMTSEANDLTKHEEEHLGQFRAICHENAMAGIEIREIPRMGIRFAIKVKQPFDGKNYTPYDPMYASLEIGGCVYREKQSITASNQRYLTTQESRLVSDAPTALSAGDVRNIRHQGMQ